MSLQAHAIYIFHTTYVIDLRMTARPAHLRIRILVPKVLQNYRQYYLAFFIYK